MQNHAAHRNCKWFIRKQQTHRSHSARLLRALVRRCVCVIFNVYKRLANKIQKSHAQVLGAVRSSIKLKETILRLQSS